MMRGELNGGYACPDENQMLLDGWDVVAIAENSSWWIIIHLNVPETKIDFSRQWTWFLQKGFFPNQLWNFIVPLI